MKKRILKDSLKEHKCSECGLPPEWNGKVLVLQLDHINGDRLDNRLDNLRLLCPNCHTQTITFSKGIRENKKNEIKIFDKNFFEKNRKAPTKEEILTKMNHIGYFNTFKTFNMSLKNFNELCLYYEIDISKYKKKLKYNWPAKIELQKLILEKSVKDISKEIGLSDRYIKKYLSKNNFFIPSNIHKAYWLKVKHNKINKVTFEDLVLENDRYILRKDYVIHK